MGHAKTCIALLSHEGEVGMIYRNFLYVYALYIAFLKIKKNFLGEKKLTNAQMAYIISTRIEDCSMLHLPHQCKALSLSLQDSPENKLQPCHIKADRIGRDQSDR
jgi:hypothetical protein